MFALEVASLACESASSFPGTPIWLGTQYRVKFLPESKIAFLIWLTMGFGLVRVRQGRSNCLEDGKKLGCEHRGRSVYPVREVGLLP